MTPATPQERLIEMLHSNNEINSMAAGAIRALPNFVAEMLVNEFRRLDAAIEHLENAADQRYLGRVAVRALHQAGGMMNDMAVAACSRAIAKAVGEYDGSDEEDDAMGPGAGSSITVEPNERVDRILPQRVRYGGAAREKQNDPRLSGGR